MITLKQLRYFTALARQGHFGRAATECAVSQPALSMQIRDLEKTLGVELVERRPGEVVLTAIGRDMASRGEQVLAAARDLMDFARHQGRLLTGRLRLGIIPTLAPYLLPRMLPALQERYSNLRLELRETQTTHLVEELSRGALDVLMLALPLDEPDIETVPLFEDPFVLAVPASDPRDVAEPVDARTIAREPLILLEEGHCLRDQALAFCAGARSTIGPRGNAAGREKKQRRTAADRQPGRTRPEASGADGNGTAPGRLHGRDQARQRAGERFGEPAMSLGATSLTTVMQMVAGGFGVTLLPQIAAAVEARDDRIKLLRFLPPEPGRTIGLAFRRTSPRKGDFTALGDLVRNENAAPPLVKNGCGQDLLGLLDGGKCASDERRGDADSRPAHPKAARVRG